MDFYILVSPCCSDSYSWQALHSPGAERCGKSIMETVGKLTLLHQGFHGLCISSLLGVPLVFSGISLPFFPPSVFLIPTLISSLPPLNFSPLPPFSLAHFLHILLCPYFLLLHFFSMFRKPNFQFYSFIQSITCFSRAAATQIFCRTRVGV